MSIRTAFQELLAMINGTNFWIILFGCLFVIAMIAIFIIQYIEQQQIEKIIEGLANGTLEITPDEFLEMRNKSFGGRGRPKYANYFEFSGVYILFNYSKNMYYIGKGQKILSRINSQFTGNGNFDLFQDYRHGDKFTIKALRLKSSRFSTLDELKQHTIETYDSYSSSYAKTRRKTDRAQNEKSIWVSPPKQICSVTQRIKSIKQPYGGYISPKRFVEKVYDDGIVLNEENIHASLIGLTVEYLTRYILGTSLKETFLVSIIGAQIAGKGHTATKLLKNIDGLSDASIISASKLSGFDVCYRAGLTAYRKPVEEINPDAPTTENIKTMVNRSVAFFTEYGPVIKTGFTFEGGYTDTVTAGDGDFLTADTIWDFKVSKNPPTSKHTLQLLMYYIMGCHSIYHEFKRIEHLGVFNPRLCKVYRFALADLNRDVIRIVEKDVIGY